MEEIIICGRCSVRCENGYSAIWNKNGTHQDEICLKCDRKERIERYAEDKMLSTRLMTEAILHKDDDRWGKRRYKHDEWTMHQLQEINKSVDRIEYEVELFDREVWFGGLGQFVREAKHSGYSAKFGKTLINKNKFMNFTTAGRSITQLEKPDGTFISLIQTDEDLNDSTLRSDYGLGVPKMGIQGILATAEEALELLHVGREAWKAGNIKLKQRNGLGF